MWQEIIVGLIVAVAAGLITRGIWKRYRGAARSNMVCSCGCTQCTTGSGEPTDCTGPDFPAKVP